jgi:hypothetical protein
VGQIISGIDPQTGSARGVVLNPDGSLPVGETNTADPTALMARLVWEIAALRRVYCEATGEFYEQYPGDG